MGPRDPAREPHVAAGHGVLDRGLWVALARVPPSGAAVQPALAIRLGHRQLGAQHLREQRIQAQARVGTVQRLARDAGARQPQQHRAGIGRAEDRVAGRGGQRREDRGPAQEGALDGGERAEHLLTDELGRGPVGSAERGDRHVQVVALGEDRGGQIHHRRPAAGPVEQPLEPVAVQPQSGAVDQHRGFEPAQRQVGRAQLEEHAAGTQPSEAGRAHARWPARARFGAAAGCPG